MTIGLAMLNELQDAELQTVIEQSQSLLKQRDQERKAKAVEQARATLAAARADLQGRKRQHPETARQGAGVSRRP